MGLRDDILSMDDRKTESVLIPQWNNLQVFVRTMGATERSKYEAKLIETKDLPKQQKLLQIKVLLVLLCACDKDNIRLFNDDDFEALAEKNADAIDIIVDAIDKLNLITNSAIEEEKGN